MLSILKTPEYDNHQMLTMVSDASTGLQGYVAVHTTRQGRAVGGTRFLDYGSSAAAIADVLRLSRAMTYKCALAELPYGGAKAVIMSPASGKTPELLRAYADVIENLKGLFCTGTDVGISDDDVRIMASKCSYMIGAKALNDPSLPTTSEMAAQGVFYAIEATLAHVTGSDNLAGRSVAIKGLGKLGGHLAKLLHAAGAKLVVADIDSKKVDGITAALPGVTAMASDEIHRAKVDVYAPCALGNDLTPERIAELRTRIVAGGANNQLAEVSGASQLLQRGVSYVPDYVANAGGLIHVTAELEPEGYNLALVQQRTKRIAATTKAILEQAEQEGRSTEDVARSIAGARIAAGVA